MTGYLVSLLPDDILTLSDCVVQEMNEHIKYFYSLVHIFVFCDVSKLCLSGVRLA